MADHATRTLDRPPDLSRRSPRRPFISRATFDLVALPQGSSPVVEGLLRTRSPELRLPETVPPRQFGGGSGAVDDITTVPAAHLSVAFVLLEMSHQVVSGGGVPQSWAF